MTQRACVRSGGSKFDLQGLARPSNVIYILGVVMQENCCVRCGHSLLPRVAMLLSVAMIPSVAENGYAGTNEVLHSWRWSGRTKRSPT